MDPYTILGIARDSTEEDVKKAYKALARQHHPDKGGDQEKFKEINGAYSQIIKGSDPLTEFPDLGEMFKMFGMFNNMSSHFTRGPTVSSSIKLSLEQLETGGVFKVKYSRNIPTGKMKTSVAHSPFGIVNVMSPEEIVKEYEVEIDVPPCHDQRHTLVFQGLAKADGVSAGDLEVTVILLNHPVFTRISGTLDLKMELTISLKEALTGFKRSIKLLNGTEDIKLECENVMNPYDTKTILTYGMNKSESLRGSLVIKFIVVFPVILQESVRSQLLEILV